MTSPPSDPFKIYPYHWPVINPGNSWAVPRICMPQFFSIQWDYAIDSWYYIGHGVDDGGNEYSFNFIVGRYAFRGRNPIPQMVYLGIGVGAQAANKFYTSFGYGLDVSDDPTHPAALIVPPVTDFSFDILLTPMFFDARARIRYTGGAPVGIAGATYRIDCQGTAKESGELLTIGLDLTDERGTMLEGASGCVAPPKETDSGVFTYEVAQPRLTIGAGSLDIGQRKIRLVGGSLWHDRQAYTTSPYGGGLLPSATTQPAELAKLVSDKVATLYRGMWIAIKLDSGISMLVSPQWAPVADKGQQWISGSAVGRPPVGGYGNLFLPLGAGTERYNGGALLYGTPVAGAPADFDVNIFESQNPQSSPHWQSGQHGNVYATKWSVTFADALARWGVPKEVYLVALVDGCENTLAGSTPFWEGAVRVYADRACTQRIGYGFAEQMGYN